MTRLRHVILICCLLLVSCAVLSADPPALRFSLPPILGSLPIAFADAWGVFAEHGLALRVIGLSDNQTRNLALMAGDIDGMVCDVPTAILLAASGTDIVITSTSYVPEQTGSLAVLSQSYFNIPTLADLMSKTAFGNTLKSIAITAKSDVEYHIDTLLRREGYNVVPDRDYSYWYDMLQVATFLSFGSVYAAVLPEPYVTYIKNFPPLKAGTQLTFLSEFEGIDLLPSVIVFRRSVVEGRPDAVAAFYGAIQETIDRLGRMERQELIETGIQEALVLFFPGSTRDTVPDGILDNFVIPTFRSPGELPRAQYDNVVAWALAKRYISRTPEYDRVTTDRFLR